MRQSMNLLPLRLLLISGGRVPGKFSMLLREPIKMRCCDGLTDCLCMSQLLLALTHPTLIYISVSHQVLVVQSRINPNP